MEELYPGLELERELTWERIFSDWCVRETGEDWGWETVWKDHGFDNWHDWRMSYVERGGLLGREWGLYEIASPSEFIPNMYVGAFKGWKPYYPAGIARTQFKDLVNLESNQKVMEIYEQFPAETTIIGVKHKDSYFVLEGTHRAAAFALAMRNKKPISTKVHIALTELRPGETALFEANTTQAL